MPQTRERSDGSVQIEELADGHRQIAVQLINVESGPSRQQWRTSYPLSLIDHVLEVKGASYLCDEIQRDEDPDYVRRFLERSILSYVPQEEFDGKRVLDLGSGCGGSTINLARMFPQAEVVGVELVPEHVELARARVRHHGMDGISFELSPGGTGLPDGLGQFDAVILSAVYEHLLPAERRSLMPEIWSRLRAGGVLFINQLPHRYSPVELHTTGLPLLNYLPDRGAFWAARHLAKRVNGSDDWTDLLRAGIRGGTVTEILGVLAAGARAQLLEPTMRGVSDRIDLWFVLSSGSRWPALKRIVRAALRAFRGVTGVTFVPELSLAISKAAGSPSA